MITLNKHWDFQGINWNQHLLKKEMILFTSFLFFYFERGSELVCKEAENASFYNSKSLHTNLLYFKGFMDEMRTSLYWDSCTIKRHRVFCSRKSPRTSIIQGYNKKKEKPLWFSKYMTLERTMSSLLFFIGFFSFSNPYNKIENTIADEVKWSANVNYISE